MYQVKTLKQSTLMKDIEESDTEFENMLNNGWHFVSLTHLEGTRDGLRYAERMIVFVRNVEETDDDEPLIFCRRGECVVNGKIVRYEPSAYDPNTWGLGQDELR